MATVSEFETAYRAILRSDLDGAAAEAIGTGTTLDAYIGLLLRQAWPTTGAAVAVSAFVTGVVPSSTKLTELTAEARLHLASYAKLGVADPSLGPFEALGRSFATDPATKSVFAARYGALDTTDFIAAVYAELYCGPVSAGAHDNLAAQIAYFTDLLGRAGVPDAALAAKGAVLGQLIGYAFLDATVTQNAVIDDSVSIALAAAAKGDESLYGTALPYVMRPCDRPTPVDPGPSQGPGPSPTDTTPPTFTSGTQASVAENTPAATVVYKAVATDASPPLIYGLSGTDKLLFSIDQTTGDLRFLAPPDFETPRDAGADNVYDIVVSATDTAGNVASRAVAITVTDVVETPSIIRASVDSSGLQSNGASLGAVMSLGGRFVAYQSSASNLVAGDGNARNDIFVYDRETKTTVRASISGVEGDGDSSVASVSQDGRYVSFLSRATNLVANDTNGRADVFLRDLQSGTTVRINGTNANGDSEAAWVSPEGRFVAYHSKASNLVAGDTAGKADIFLFDRQTAQTSRVSGPGVDGLEANLDSFSPVVTANGGAVFYLSGASNLVAGDTNGAADIFRFDTAAGLTTRVSVDGVGGQANGASNAFAVSANGRYLAFQSSASNLVGGDTNGVRDIFWKDLQTGTVKLVSVADSGVQADKASSNTAISANGRYVAFQSDATNLVPGDTNQSFDIFVRDMVTEKIHRVSLNGSGGQATGAGGGVGAADSATPAISADGRYVSFHSSANNLVPGDTNGVRDVFVVDGLAQGWWFNIA